MHLSPLLLLTSLLSTTHSHGIVTSPPPRSPGPAHRSACGLSVSTILEKDNQTSIESLVLAASHAADFKKSECDPTFCKGLQLKDNLHNIQNWTAGQEVMIQVWERIPHTGWVSVAIVDAETRFIVGEELITFETRSFSGFGVVDREFVVRIPKVFPRCLMPGECVLQWTWFGRVVKQTYESCVDFVIAPEKYDVGDGGWDENSQRIMVEEVEY